MSGPPLSGLQARDRIRTFLHRAYPATRKLGLADNTELLASGIVDSLGILDLVQFLETEFSIHITDDELVPENFEDLNQLAQFIQRKNDAASLQRSE